MKFIKALAVIILSVVILGAMIRACESSSSSNSTSASVATDTAMATVETNEKTWQYSSEEDKMTSKKTYYAQIEANELLEFDFPYNGGSTATLIIRNKGGENNVYLSVTKGQMLTKSYEATDYRVRFDDKPPQYYPFIGPSDNSSTVVFINSTARFIKNLKQAKKVILEIQFYQEGSRPIEFNAAGLKWEH